MTLDEAIEKMKHMADSGYETASAYHTDEGVYINIETHFRENADDYMQIVDFLEELKARREDKWVGSTFLEQVNDSGNT